MQKNTRSHLLPLTDRLAQLPYWLLLAILLGLFFLWTILNDTDYNTIFKATTRGIGTTVYVSVIAYMLALILGLMVGLMRVSRSRLVQELASFYVEIVRGVPMLVILYYIAFVGAPAIVSLYNFVANPLIKAELIQALNVRQLDFTVRAIMALTIGYSAFISEIFRAGIESVNVGQMQAAQALGMTYWQGMRYIVLPQAIRNVLPPLGNDFIAMLKDSALVSALGVQDITQLGKVYSASTFKFFETYNVVAFLYLIMTVGLSLGVRSLEKRLGQYVSKPSL
ncbi:MAG: amino acid ABC transporter permease [Anaerolineae bacterium]|nr:amino acid ABC transporter permease [Anaerolineae bacterium]